MSDAKGMLDIKSATPSSDELLAMVRARLASAMELLGLGSEETVLDESITGAGILAHDAGDLLEVMFERRVSKATEASDG